MSKKSGITGLTLAALGVVYGDIGTSPLYTVNEIFFAHGHMEVDKSNVLGVISLVLWALFLIVSIQYIIFVLKADYEGEGGVFALLGNLKKTIKLHNTRFKLVLSLLLIIGAGLLFGDGLITPAISVLSAVEGLKVATPNLSEFVVPITIGILFALFFIQRHGTSKIGRLFGPIILTWFAAISLLGLKEVVNEPEILIALNPIHALRFISNTPIHHLMLILGSVMLAVTGGEALYADMGHFGKRPIRFGWFFAVFPSLIMNYMGQGAFLLGGSAVINDNIFYSMVPRLVLLPIIILATISTVIASQALISGVFSLASQAISFGFMPRLKVVHTHHHHEGQIYMPAVNWILFAGCSMLVIGFGSASKLASAYGLAVSGNMLITALCMAVIAHGLWKWSNLKAWLVFGFFFILESGFLIANSLKLIDGGYIPLAIAALSYVVMTTWAWGRKHVKNAFHVHNSFSMSQILQQKQKQKSSLKRSILILSPEEAHEPGETAPPLLNLFLEKYGSLPDHTIILNIKQIKSHAKIASSDRFAVTEYQNDHKNGLSLLAVTATYGFMETPNIKKAIKWIANNEDLTPDDDMKDWIIYAGRERLIVDKNQKFHHKFRANLFRLLSRNSSSAYSYFGLGGDLRVTMEMIPIKLKG
jgi:KUP system potassium uptake protein